MTGPNHPRDGCGCIGCVGDVTWRDGLEGVAGEAGDGRAGVEYDREPRLPPLPARANASPACTATVSVTKARPTAQRIVFGLSVIPHLHPPF